uniref:TIMELESS-interacting protein n=1 Tax=Meloidogyne hapla TaxID=6305 RepID=A0A1I8B8F7_MELHA
MEFDDFGDLFGDEMIEMEDKNMENEENEGKDFESVWEKTEEDENKNKRKIRRPQPKLSEREITSEKGIEALKTSFNNFNFPNEYNPYQKLEILLNKMECWAHNLFPKMNFDDCLDKIEKLGRKRLVQATMKRLRPGFSPVKDDEFEVNEDENIEKDGAKLFNSKYSRKKDEEIIDSSDEDNDDLDKYLNSLKQSNSQKENDSDENSEIIQIKNTPKRRKVINEDD